MRRNGEAAGGSARPKHALRRNGRAKQGQVAYAGQGPGRGRDLMGSAPVRGMGLASLASAEEARLS